MNGQELAVEISNAVNSGIDPQSFKQQVRAEHNALQRYMFRQVFKPGIIALARVNHTDARNEHVVAEAREVCDRMDWDY